MRTRFFVRSLAVVPFVLLVAAPAFAQKAKAGGPIAPLSSSLTGDARVDYESAKGLYDIGDFNGAYLKFKHAFEVSSDSRLLWNMAVCEKEMHHYARSVTLVERYLKEAGDKIPPEAKANATATLDTLHGLFSPATLNGVPAGAKVILDDAVIGTTPLAEPMAFDVGNHKIRIEHPDYEVFEKSIDGVAGGKPFTIDVKLIALSEGQLHVAAAPGDSIIVDGKLVGAERWDGAITPGRHTVRVTALHKKPYEVVVEMTPRGSKSLQVTLLDEDKAAVWPWLVAGGAVLAGGAVVGGYFLFKPDDKPGPHTSGGLGTVFLSSHRSF